MLMTHVRPGELVGKKVYGKDGRLLGRVVRVSARRGAVRAIVSPRRLPAKLGSS
jgi:ribosomal protein L35AE/L33A